MGTGGLIEALTRGLRALTGMRSDDTWSPLRVGVYTFLGCAAMVLVFAWLTQTPLDCMASHSCPR